MRRGIRRAARAWALATLLAPAALAAQAQDTTRSDTAVYRLEPLSASVTRDPVPLDLVPLATSVVPAAAFRTARPQVDLHEALRRVPGVAVDNRHNLALGTRISIRGFGARSAFGVRGVRLLVDGIPLTLPDGQATLTNVDLGSAERIEVLRGPAAVLYGNAAGGVVSVRSMEPPAEGLAEARVAAGTNGTEDATNLVRLQANAGDRWTSGSWFVGVSHLDLDGYRDHSRARRSGVNGRLRWAPDDRSRLTVLLNAATVPEALNPGSLPRDSVAADPRMAWPTNVATASGEEAAQVQGGVSYARRLGPVELEAAAFGQGRRLENPLPFGRYIRLRRAAGGGRLLASGAAAGPVSWAGGLEVQTQRDRRLERDNVDGRIGGQTYRDQVDRVTAVAPFGTVQLPLGGGVEARAGARYDRVRFETADWLDSGGEDHSGGRTLDAWSGSLGLTGPVWSAIRGWVSASSWFQTPTTTELINAPPTGGEPCCPGGFNPDLEPEDGVGLEMGLRGAGAVRWEAVAYLFRADNLILPFQVQGADGREFYRNAGQTRHRGLELSAEAPVASGVVAGLAYAFTDLRFDGDASSNGDEDRVPGVAPHRLDAYLDWRGGPWSAGVEAEWVSRYPVDDSNTAFNDAYTVLDVRAARAFALGGLAVEPFVAVSNVLDRAYSGSVVINAFGGRYYEPAPGRAWMLGLRTGLR